MRRTMAMVVVLGSAVALVAAAVDLLQPVTDPGDVRAALTVADAMHTPADAGYARATEARPFVFPADHGPHPDFRTEWWYVTGNLQTAAGRHFGFQFTLFRTALAPAPVERESVWGTRQLWMGHIALTDTAAGRFSASERFARGALGLAGATAEPFRVWLEDIELTGATGDDAFPMQLRAATDAFELDLSLDPAKPRVNQGDDGLSAKGDEPGNASYYYAWTRLAAAGTVRTDGDDHAVIGLAWLDREWSTSALGEGVVGWDWFSLQLDDGNDLMLYQLRHDDGSADPASEGSLVDPAGRKTRLHRADFTIEVLDHWTSPRSSVRYPARWRLRVPTRGIDLTVEPVLPDQELDVTVRYWEGAVRITGSATGHGYVELTGYADE